MSKTDDAIEKWNLEREEREDNEKNDRKVGHILRNTYPDTYQQILEEG